MYLKVYILNIVWEVSMLTWTTQCRSSEVTLTSVLTKDDINC